MDVINITKTQDTVKKPRKIGILGGSFNPIHIGHMEIARYLLDNGLDEIRFLLNPCSPFKTKVKMPDAYHRAQMILRAINSSYNADYASRMSLDTTEMLSSLQNKVCYTVNTLKKILYEDLNNGAQNEYFFIMGVDVFNDLCKGKFKDWKWFIEEKLVRIIVLPRGGYDINKNYTGEFSSIMYHIDFNNFKPIEMSSTAIRQYIEIGDDDNMKETMYKEEMSYIKSLKLYGYPHDSDNKITPFTTILPAKVTPKTESCVQLPTTEQCKAMLNACPYKKCNSIGALKDSYIRVYAIFSGYTRYNIYNLANNTLVFPTWMVETSSIIHYADANKKPIKGKTFQFDYEKYNTNMFAKTDDDYYAIISLPETIKTRKFGDKTPMNIARFNQKGDVTYVLDDDCTIWLTNQVTGLQQGQRVISITSLCYGVFLIKTTTGTEIEYNILSNTRRVTKFETL